MIRTMSPHGRALALMGLFTFGIVCFANVRYTRSDALGALLVSETILQQQTIKLDSIGAESLERYAYRVHQKSGHWYYYFPIGTPLFSVPFVAIANASGFEMARDGPKLQIVIAAVLSVVMLGLLYLTARMFLPQTDSLVAAACFLFGTSLVSTNATALWSHDFAVVFSSAAVYLLVRDSMHPGKHRWAAIGVLLFCSYLCRPTAALLIPLALAFYFSFDRRAAVSSAVVLGFLLLGFGAFSYAEFGQPLPDYYLPKRLAGGEFVTALVGNLISPARGLLVFSPFILVAALGAGLRRQSWPLSRAWLLLGLVWPVLHLLSVSRFPHWWGGWCYGPRLMTDALPGLFLLTLRGWPTWPTRTVQWAQVSALAVAATFSIFVHSYKGLFDYYTQDWNHEPNVDQHPEYIFDWDYPQFLYSRTMHPRRVEAHSRRIDGP